MKQVLYNYDVYPKVFLQNTTKAITVQPLGSHSGFAPEHTYTVRIFKVNQANPHKYPERSGRSCLKVTPCDDGNLRFSAFFEGEGEHFINIYQEESARRLFETGRAAKPGGYP